MAAEEVKKFLEQARTDAALGEKYRSSLEGAMMKAIADVACEHGFAVTTEELRDYFSGAGAELSEHDLGAVVGGVGSYSLAQPNLVMCAAAAMQPLGGDKGLH
jgi:predicted ribosomally synthesized peptide with nif11-like leader